jgi:hypothetical protein
MPRIIAIIPATIALASPAAAQPVDGMAMTCQMAANFAEMAAYRRIQGYTLEQALQMVRNGNSPASNVAIMEEIVRRVWSHPNASARQLSYYYATTCEQRAHQRMLDAVR